jgi:hypothetical protein
VCTNKAGRCSKKCSSEQAEQAKREKFAGCAEYTAFYASAAKIAAKETAAATKQRVWVAEPGATLPVNSHQVTGGAATSLSLQSYSHSARAHSENLVVTIVLEKLSTGFGKDNYGSPKGVTQFGIKCGKMTHLMRLTDCCSESGTYPYEFDRWSDRPEASYTTRACIPDGNCPGESGSMTFNWNSAAGNWSYSVDGASSYSLFGGICRDEPAHLYAVLGDKAATLSDLRILTEEENFKIEKVAKGATEAKAGRGSCGADFAPCGPDGRCWGVCAPNTCGPPRFCMCYPRGYWGEREGWHEGAHCLTSCLDMGKCDFKPSPSSAEKVEREALEQLLGEQAAATAEKAGTCTGNRQVKCTSDHDCDKSRCNADPAVGAPKKYKAYADEP